MNLCITLDAHFERTPDGKVWCDSLYPYFIWQPYLDVFDQVKVIARMKNVDMASKNFLESGGHRVTFVSMPDFIGPTQFLFKYFEIKRLLQENVWATDAVLSRSINCFDVLLYPILKNRNQSFGVQVIGNPNAAMTKGAYKSLFRPYLKYRLTKLLKSMCQDARVVTYVTRESLQRFYPPSEKSFSNYFSNVKITPDAIIDRPRQFQFFSQERPARIIFVGSLANLRKAPDILLKAVAKGIGNGLFLHLTFVGGGREETGLRDLAESLGISSHVEFLGSLPGVAAVRQCLDRSDLFILPSRIEGLPRAVVEAMARALPCIGSNTDGIPELLPPEWIVPVNDVSALVNAIERMVKNPEFMNQESLKNLNEAKDHYHIDRLSVRQREFLEHLRRVTQERMNCN